MQQVFFRGHRFVFIHKVYLIRLQNNFKPHDEMYSDCILLFAAYALVYMKYMASLSLILGECIMCGYDIGT